MSAIADYTPSNTSPSELMSPSSMNHLINNNNNTTNNNTGGGNGKKIDIFKPKGKLVIPPYLLNKNKNITWEVWFLLYNQTFFSLNSFFINW